MNKNYFLILTIVVVLVGSIWLLRYEVVPMPTTSTAFFKLDRWTGHVYVCRKKKQSLVCDIFTREKPSEQNQKSKSELDGTIILPGGFQLDQPEPSQNSFGLPSGFVLDGAEIKPWDKYQSQPSKE